MIGIIQRFCSYKDTICSMIFHSVKQLCVTSTTVFFFDNSVMLRYNGADLMFLF